MARRFWVSIALATLQSLSGCARIFGPEAMPVASASGVVTEGRHRVGGGWIEFFPVEGTIGKRRSARLNADGSFHATGVPVGVNQVRIVNARIESPVVARLMSDFASPIRRIISRDDRQVISIDLLEETVRFQASLSSRTGARGPAATKGTP